MDPNPSWKPMTPRPPPQEDDNRLLTETEKKWMALMKLVIHFRDIVIQKQIPFPRIRPIRQCDLVGTTKLLRQHVEVVLAYNYGGPEKQITKEAVEVYWNDLKSEFVVSAEPVALQTAGSIANRTAPIYEALENGQDLRLLYLLPATQWNDPLECKIVPAAFADGLKYEALSYTWGLQSGIQSSLTILNSSRDSLQITSNLDSALRDLRADMNPSDDWRVLWVDAICIDQSNLQEKSHQIRQMKRVYSEATQVIVWLGRSTDKASKAFEILTSMKEFLNNFSSMILEPEGTEAPDLDPLNTIGESPWWTRAWCLQEIVMAKQASMYIGSTSIPWHVVSSAFWTWYGFWARRLGGQADPRFSNMLKTISQQFPHYFFDQLGVVEQCRHQTRLPTFLELLANHGNLLTTDPRDQIYAFLGLVDATDPCNFDDTLVPDYTKRLSDLLIRVVVHLLKHHGLDVISFATQGLISAKFIHDVYFLPKWTPDWRNTSLREGAHFAFTNFLWATDPAQRFMAEFSRTWQEANRALGRERAGQKVETVTLPVPETREIGHPSSFAADVFFSPETFQPLSPSLFNASFGLEGPAYEIIDSRGPRADFVELVCSGFTVDVIENLGEFKGTTIEKILNFADTGGKNWGPDSVYTHIPTQTRSEALLRTALADQWPKESDANAGNFRLKHPLPWNQDKERSSSSDGTGGLDPKLVEAIFDGSEALCRFAAHRKFFTTKKGYFGLASLGAAKGDPVVVFVGASVPFVLNWHAEDRRWHFIGDCYIHGAMDGEAVKQWEAEGGEIQNYTIM